MNKTLLYQTIMTTLLVYSLTACTGSHDHAPDHGESYQGHKPHPEGPEPISVTFFSETLELFMEYPPLVKGEKARFIAHFTVLETGDPVREGKLIAELTKPGTEPFEIEIPGPKRDGLFVPVLQFGSASRYRVRFKIEGPQISDIVDLGELVVHDTKEKAQEASISASQHHDAIPFFMEQQWKINMKLSRVFKRPLSPRISVPATLEPPSGSEVVISVPLPGRLRRAPTGEFLVVGKQVTKGEVLAVLELQPEVASKVRKAKVKRLFAHRKLKRIEEIKNKGVGSEQQYDQAKEELELAEAQYKSLLGATQVASLSNRSKEENSESNDLSVLIVAPVSGEVVSAVQKEGAFISANQEIAQVLNSDLVWVHARVSEFDISELNVPGDAFLRLDAFSKELFSVVELGGRLLNVGTRVDQQSRTLPVRYELPNPKGKFKIGMFGTVSMAFGPATECVSIPESAVVMDNGVATAYVLLSGQSFQKRELKLGIRDRGFVEILEGVQPDERVVSSGGYAVKLAAASPASFGHGHAH